MKRARHFLATAAALAAGHAAAADGGFSYVMGLGWQDFRYEEASSMLPVRSVGKSGGPVLVTGGLYELDNGHQFSLDSENTFYPGRGSEHWRSTSAVFGGVTLTSPELQSNGFSLRQSNTQFTGHWKLPQRWYASVGAALRTQSFKRYGFVVGPDKAVNVPTGTTIEESTSEVLGSIGAAYESGPLRGQDVHYGFRVSVAAPLWRRLENTSQPQALFTGTRGWDRSLEGRYSRAVIPHVHLGVWGKWQLSTRGAQTLGSSLELPNSKLSSWAGGLELLWKL
jgi:hypothetical protein